MISPNMAKVGERREISRNTMIARISHERRMTRGMVGRMARKRPNTSTIAFFTMGTIGSGTAQRKRLSTLCLVRPGRNNRRHQ